MNMLGSTAAVPYVRMRSDLVQSVTAHGVNPPVVFNSDSPPGAKRLLADDISSSLHRVPAIGQWQADGLTALLARRVVWTNHLLSLVGIKCQTAALWPPWSPDPSEASATFSVKQPRHL